MEEHMLEDVNPLNGSQYFERLVANSQPEDTRVHQPKKKKNIQFPQLLFISIFFPILHPSGILACMMIYLFIPLK